MGAIAAIRERPGLVVASGVALVVAMVATTVVVVASFGGHFSRDVVVTVELPRQGSAVALDSPVDYRQVSVGKVVSPAAQRTGGAVTVKVELRPSELRSIPASVRATVGPVSIFGNEYVQLVPPAHPVPGAPTLHAGQVVEAAPVRSTPSLQTTFGDLDRLLVQVHPGQLDAALAGVADALKGQGRSLGATLAAADAYFGQMLSLWPTLVADLRQSVPAADALAAETPKLLDLVQAASAVGRTVSSSAPQLGALLTNGSSLTGQTSTLLQQIEQPYAETIGGAAPLLAALSQTPTEIGTLLTGLDTWAKAWATATQGPYLAVQASPIVVRDPADLVLAALGGPDPAGLLQAAVGEGFVDPPTYAGGTVQASQGAGAGILPADLQVRAAAEMVSGFDRGAAPVSAQLAALLLSPEVQAAGAAP